MTDSVEIRDLPDRITVRNETVEVISGGTMGPASLALGSLIDGPANSILRMTADGPVWMPIDETPIVKRLSPVTQQMVSPPTVTQGAANDPSVIAGSSEMAPDNAALTYFGCRVDFGLVFPNSLAYSPSNITDPAGSKDLYVSGIWGVEFEFDGDEFELHVKGSGGRHRCTVVGEGYVSRAGQPAVPADGNGYLVHYDFGAAKARRIRFDFEGNTFFYGIVFNDTSYSVTTTTLSLGPRVVIIGDSFTEGSAALVTYSMFADRLRDYLNWRDIATTGWGSTGYLNDFAGARETFRTRLQKDVIDAEPDIVIFAGGINDTGIYDQTDFEIESTGCFDDIQTALPDCQIIVLGPFWPNGYAAYMDGPTEHDEVIRVRDSLKLTSLDYARLFIDNLGGPYPYSSDVTDYQNVGWMTGSGRVGNEQHDGNSDYYTSADNTHPTQAGHDYLALRLAEAIALDAPELLG